MLTSLGVAGVQSGPPALKELSCALGVPKKCGARDIFLGPRQSQSQGPHTDMSAGTPVKPLKRPMPLQIPNFTHDSDTGVI